MSDCCLMPSELFFSYIMARTSYNFSAIGPFHQILVAIGPVVSEKKIKM
jgi:hypothetical protein